MENSENKESITDSKENLYTQTMEIVDSSEAKEVTSVTSVGSSPTSTTDFVYVDDNVSNSSKKSRSSFTDVCSNPDDYMPKMEQTDQDVSKLVSEAQMDVFISDYYTDEKNQTDNNESSDRDLAISSSPEGNETESSHSTDEEDGDTLNRSSSEGEAKDACVLFHGITYLGASNINAPVSDLELKRAISILRDHKEGTISVILSVSLSPTGSIRLLDPVSRAEIAKYDIDNICFWGKGESETEEKDCLAFNIKQGKEEVIYHCHVFQCAEEDDVTRILQSIAQTIKKDQRRKQAEFPSGKKGSRLDPNNLSFKFNVVLDVWEEDGKGSFQQVSRDRNHFKLKVELQRKVVFVIEQITNRKLNIERVFGLLLAQGRDVKDEDLHLLQQVNMEPRPGKTTVITGHWDPKLEFWKVLNTDPRKDTKVYMTVAADVVFKDLKEPVRFVKEVKVRVFPINEKFWNPAKPRIQEEFTLNLKENFTELGEKWFEKESLHSASDIAKLKSAQQSISISSVWKNGRSSKPPPLQKEMSEDVVEIMGPEEPILLDEEEEQEDEEPLLSGSGEFQRSYSDSEMSSWTDVLQKWKDLDHRPSKLLQSVRKGIPDPLRGQVWQMLSGFDDDADAELLKSYAVLCNKDSPQEQVILWDVTRTFPAHEYFREANGDGQNAMYRISKAYSVYDEEVGYCQGLSFIIAAYLLHVPPEQAYCLLVKTMYTYGHRELFRDGFAYLHQCFYVLERVLEDSMPDLYHHFRANGIEIHMFASQWFLTLFTAKFPLSLVFNILDIILCEGLDMIFQVAAALLKNAKKDLLTLNFEGILKYFRINLPKYYMKEIHRRELIKVLFELKISKKKIAKYKQEYVQMKEEEELKEDPVIRLQRENQRLLQDNLRLERENDSLAHEVVTTQVSMQEVITDREEKLNEMTKETEQMRKHLMEADEESERLRMEEARVKDMWRGSMNLADQEKSKRDRIIDDYKQILTRLEERTEKLKKNFASETELLKKQVGSCENCTNALLKNIYPDSDEPEAHAQQPTVTRLLTKEDHEEQMRSLEEELIKTKVALAEEKNRADEIEMKLHSLVSANEKPWYKKVTINTKR